MRSAGTDIFAYITAEQFVALISMAGAGEISSRAAKDILGILVEKAATRARSHGARDCFKKR